MPDPSTLLAFCGVSMAVLVFPGPAVIYIVTRGATQGRAAGLVSMLGIEAGNLVHVVAAAAGLSAILASSAEAFTVVKYLGAAYLVYLGVRALLDGEERGLGGAATTSRSRLFGQGVTIAVLNPKTALFFLAFLPQFVEAGDGAGRATQRQRRGLHRARCRRRARRRALADRVVLNLPRRREVPRAALSRPARRS